LSPLTKLFVALLVIVSMLNAAAIVVFVNEVQPLKPALDAAQSQLSAAHAQVDSANAAREHSEGQYNAEVQLHQKDNSDNQTKLTGSDSDLNNARVTIARLQADNTNLQSALNTANSNVQLSTSTANKLQEQVTELRTSNDTLAKQNEEFGRRTAQLTSVLDSLHAKDDETQENLAQAKDDKQKLAAALKDRGYDPDMILKAPEVNAVSAASIEGVVADKSVINGNTFVTINVGSSQGVQQGMKFYVVNGPEFLGIVTIDTVDTDDAIGKLEGAPDKVASVQKGNEVKTQLRGS